MQTGIEVKQAIEQARDARAERLKYLTAEPEVQHVLKAGVDIAFEQFWAAVAERQATLKVLSVLRD